MAVSSAQELALAARAEAMADPRNWLPAGLEASINAAEPFDGRLAAERRCGIGEAQPHTQMAIALSVHPGSSHGHCRHSSWERLRSPGRFALALATQPRSTPAWWLKFHSTASMRQTLSQLSLQTGGEGFTDISAALNAEIARSGLTSGLATVHVLHTSCSLTINENADPRVLQDLAAYLQALVPQEGVKPLSGRGGLRAYAHDDEGPDDMPAHIRTALTATSLSLAFEAGRLVLGTWQAVYLWEHRAVPHRRRLSLHLLGE